MDPFDWDLSEGEISIMEQQATQLLHNNDTTVASLSGDVVKDATNDIGNTTFAMLKNLQSQVETLQKELDRIQREKMTREGEVSLLRQKLNSIESEKYEASKRNAAKLEVMEQERQAMILHSQREVERLQMELKFKEVETFNTKGKISSGANNSGFTDAFEDLRIAQKRPKAALNVTRSTTKDSAIEADLISKKSETKELTKSVLLESLYKALGLTDKIFMKLDLPDYAGEEAKMLRDSIQRVSNLTGDPILAIENEYRHVYSDKIRTKTHYLALVLKLMLSTTPGLGEIVRNKKNFDVSEEIRNRLKNLPTESRLVQHLCRFLTDLAPGICLSMVKGHLIILTRIFQGSKSTLPNCVISLVERGTLAFQLNAFKEMTNAVNLHVFLLLLAMEGDPRLPMAMMKQLDQPLECSTLNCINTMFREKLVKKPFHVKFDAFEMLFFDLLIRLCTEHIFPVSVAFEPATLRLLARRLGGPVVNKDEKLDYSSTFDDIILIYKIFYRVIMVEKAPIVKVLVREFLFLHAASDKFANMPGLGVKLKPCLQVLKPILDSHFEDIKAGKYLPGPLIPIQRRDRPQTPEEEAAMHKEIEASRK